MKSIIVSLSGKSPSISTNLHPEIELDERFEYSCCLLDFSIHNISLHHKFSGEETFNYIRKDGDQRKVNMKPGVHFLPDVMKQMEGHMVVDDCKVHIRFDKYKMRFQIQTHHPISFYRNTSFGRLIGFEPQLLEHGSITDSDHRIGQIDAETIRVNCDLVGGSFHDGNSTHIIHEFHPKPVSNYIMFEQPQHLTYLPVIRRRIDSVNVTVTDQEGKLLDLKGGEIRCRLIITRNCIDPHQKKC